MPHVVVIGGGIAGPVAAMALKQAGFDATVYEAYTDSAGLTTGVFLTVAVNGLDALAALDAHDPVMRAGFPTREIEFYSGSGKRLGRLPIGGMLEDGTVTHTIKRSDLYRVVHAEALRRGIRIEHGKRVVQAHTTGRDRVVASFADGSEAEGDVLVGADGIHSTVRRILDPGAPVPRYNGMINIGGFTRLPGLDAAPGVYQIVFGKRCFFGYTITPEGEVWWFANPLRPQPLSRDELAGTGGAEWKRRLVELFADDHTPAAAIVEATNGGLRATNQYDLPSVPTWRRGRTILIGDAAHAVPPSSGQGVSQAAEDAVVLAQCLRDVADAGEAFAVYERIRRDRVERVAAESARRNATKAGGALRRVMRDMMLPTILKRVARRSDSFAWIYEHHLDWPAPVNPAAGAPTAGHRSPTT